MRSFAALYDALDRTTKTNEKVAAMVDWFQRTPPEEAAWAVFFLTGQRFKRLVSTRPLREWAAELSDTPPWLFEQSYANVGDLGETIALLIDAARGEGETREAGALSLDGWVERIVGLRGLEEEEQRERIVGWWQQLGTSEIFLLNKMLTGGLRVGVSKTLVARALAQVAGVPQASVSHRLMGGFEPSAAAFEALCAEEDGEVELSRPYPFFLASPLESAPEELGEAREWQAEWKWDGIRAQLIRRGGETFLWSRGEELVTERFPELHEGAARLPDGTALDGELLCWRDGAPLSFAVMQKRIGRKRIGPKILADAPVAFMGYDLMEHGGEDWRERPLGERRAALEESIAALAEPERFLVSPIVKADDWEGLAEQREASRTRGVEGLMLKRRSSPYRTGRRKGDWWKWKVDPLSIDAVLIYARRGTGGAPISSPTTPSRSGATASWCPWPKPTRGSTTRRSVASIAGSARTRRSASAPCAR